MNSKNIFRVVMALVLIAALAGLGAGVYYFGFNQGLASAPEFAAGKTFDSVFPFHPGMAAMHRPFGFGFFGPLSCLGPLFLFMLVIFALRALFWGGPRGRHFMHGPWGAHCSDANGHDVPPMFAEWHRRVHAQPEETPPAEQ